MIKTKWITKVLGFGGTRVRGYVSVKGRMGEWERSGDGPFYRGIRSKTA